MKVTQEHIDTYNTEGAVCIRGAFSSAWVDTLTADLLNIWEQFMAGKTPPVIAPNAWQNAATCSNEVYGGYEIRNASPCSVAIQDWIKNSPAAEYVAALTGAETVRFWMDSTFIKEPETGQGATPWHTDGSTYPFWGEQMPTMWVPLTDCDEDNAPLITVAHSHKVGKRFHSNLSRQDVKLDGYRDWSDLLDIAHNAGDDLRVWTANAGDMVLMHPQMIHASKARNPDKQGRRIGLSTRWLGSDPRWTPDAYAASIPALENHPDMTFGAGPPESIFPIVYRAN